LFKNHGSGLSKAARIALPLALSLVVAGCAGGPSSSTLPQMAQSNSAKQQFHTPATAEHAAAWKAAHPQPGSQPVPGTHRAQTITITGCYDVYYGPDYKTGLVTPDDTYEYSYCNYINTPDPTSPAPPDGGGCPTTSTSGMEAAIGGCIAKGTDCSDALAQDTTTDGTDAHDSQISARFAIWDNNSTSNAIIGYEYQTYGGQEYYEFGYGLSGSLGFGPVSGSVGAPPHILYPSHGSVYQTIQWLMNLTHTLQSTLPGPFKNLAPSDVILKNPCHVSTAA